MKNFFNNNRNFAIRKIVAKFLSFWIFCILLVNYGFAATSISGYAYYLDYLTKEPIQIENNHYTLQFFWIDPLDRSVHIVAGNGSTATIEYAADGSYSVEIPDEYADLDLYAVIFPEDEKEDAFYTSYHPATLEIESAVSFIPNQVNGAFSPNGVGKEIIERPIGLSSKIKGNLIFKKDFKNSENFTPTIISLVQNNIPINNTSTKANNYELLAYPGIYKIIFSRPGYTTQIFTINVSEAKVSDLFIDIDFAKINHSIQSVTPDKFVLEQNFPNPFNPTTSISFSLPKDAVVTLKVFDISGKEVAVLLNNEFKQANSYSVTFNGINLSSGVYFYSLEAEGFTDTKKMILIK